MKLYPPRTFILFLLFCLFGLAPPALAQWDADDVVLKTTNSATGTGNGYVVFSAQANSVTSNEVTGSSSKTGYQSRVFSRTYIKTGSPPPLTVSVSAEAYTTADAWGGFPFGTGEGETEGYAESLTLGSSPFAYAEAYAYSNSGTRIDDWGYGGMPLTSDELEAGHDYRDPLHHLERGRKQRCWGSRCGGPHLRVLVEPVTLAPTGAG
jgi:hypothetical protein